MDTPRRAIRAGSLRIGSILLAFLGISASDALAQTLSSTALSFGNQVVGQTSAPKTTTFRNNTGAPLRINSIAMIGTNAADFEVTSNCPIAPTQLLAGDNCVLSVTLTASALGTRTATLRIRHSTAASPQTVALTGTGVDPVKLTPSTNSLSFANTPVGNTTAPKSVTLTNKKNVALTFGSIVATGDFAITSNTCGASIAAGANCAVGVAFAPTAVGTRAGSLTFTDDAANSPQTVTLSGIGIVAVKAAPATQSFAARSVGTTSGIQNVTITNQLTSPVTITGAAAVGDFAVASNTCTTLAPAATCTIGVTFTPTAVGTRTGMLSISHSAFGSPATVKLTGTGNANGLTSIAVTPVNPSLTLGLTRQFTATGTFTGGRTANLTTSVNWTSSVPAVATISNLTGTRGIATSVALGTTLIKGSLGAINGSTTLTVTPVTLASIAVAPQSPSIALGTEQQFTATGTYTNGSTVDLTNSVNWSSSDPLVAGIDSAGLATSANVGSTDVTATSGAITGTATLTVSPAALVSISVTPLDPTVAKGLKQQFTATGLFTDGTTQDLTSSATWTSSAPAVATIDAAGLATAAAAGTTSIAAGVGAVAGQTTMTVGSATLVSISVIPSDASIALGTKQQYSATGTYTDGSTEDLTASVAWASSAASVATIDAAGLATSATTGATIISATSGAVTGSTNLTVTPAALVTIAVTPAIPSIALGRTQQFTATGTFTDGTIQDITNTVTWSSSEAAVATISMSAATSGLATSLGVGTTTISAASAGVSGNTTVTVTPAVIVGIAVTPSPLSLAKGTSQQLTATATFSDGTTGDVTSTAAWASSDSNVLGVSSAGLATAAGVGLADVSAVQDSVTGYTAGQVTPAVLTAIAITPVGASIPLGTTQQFTAQGTYTDGSTQDVTGTAHWSSSDGTIATLSNAPATAGLASTVAVGTVTVSATIGSVSETASLSVTPAALVSIAVTPATATIPLGTGQQFTATGSYTDGTTKDITTTVTWSTSLATVAIVSNAIGSEGLATSSGVGDATITATSGTIAASASLTVASAQIVSIAVTPATATVSAGQTQLFVATATYTDGTTADVTTSVTWSSSSSAVATIDAAGDATAVAAGSATITAMSGSVQGTAELSVVALASISSFTASPTTVTTGASSQLTPSFTGGTGVISPGNLSVTSGSSVTVTPASTTTYTLTVTNSVGSTASAAATVTVVPAPVITSFTASPATITSGTSTSLTAVFANGSGVVTPGNIAVSSGVLIAVSPAANTTYTLTVTNAAGTVATRTASVVVVPAPTITSFTATPTTVKQGSSSSLTAVFANGTATIDNGVGAVSSGVAKTVTPAVTTTFTLTVTNAAGTSANATATVTVATLQSIAIVPTSATIPVGSQGRFTATGTYSDGSTANVSNQVTWSSSDTAFATVNSTGLVTGVGSGTATITAVLGSVSGIAGVTVTAVSGAAGRFVYAANASGQTVSGYILDQATGALTGVPGSPTSTASLFSLTSISSHPSGRFVYVGGYYGVTGFSSNATTGQLTAIAGGNPAFNYDGTGRQVYGVGVEPTGRFVYTANRGTNTVSAYAVDGGNGALMPIATYTTGQCPASITVDPSGKFVYVATECGSPAGVWGYAIDGTTGGLTPVAGSPFGGTAVTAVAAAPNGQVLYAISDNRIRGYTINSTTGALTLISGFPVTTSVCCTYYSGLTVDPTGRFLYAAAYSGSVSAYGIDAVTGGITAVAGSPFSVATGSQTYGVSVDASGKFLYVSSFANTSGNPGTVVALAINQTSGALTVVPGSPFAAGSVTYAVTTTGAAVVSAATLQSIEISPSSATISTVVLGKKLQLVLLGHYSDGTTQFLTESASWSSSVTTKATISTTAGSKGLATSTGYGTTTITASYSVFTVTATLTVQQPTVASIAVTPTFPTIASGTAIQFTAVATYSDGSTQTITSAATWTSSDTAVATVSNAAGSIGLTTGLAAGTATLTATYNGVSGAASVTVTAVSSAAGRFVYAANQGSNNVSGYILDQATGALTAVPGSPVSYSNGVLSVASHPSGRFVYVGGYYGVTGFSSNGTTGQLTPIPGGNPFFGYTGTSSNTYVYSLAVDPTGRYVYAANQQASTVSAYMVDGGNGALTPVATYATGQCPYSVTVDPSGKFVYVGNGCGTGGVSAYAIDGSTGGLTPVAGSPFGGTAVTAVAAAPNGQVLYAISSNSIRGYTINSTTGALTLISGFPVTSVCCTQFGGLTVDPAGRFLYAAASSGSVSAYRIDAVTGGITAVAGSPFSVATGSQTYGVSVDASGKFLYVSSYANTSGNLGTVVALAINQTSGALTVVPGSPFATAGSVTYAVTTTGAVVSSAATLQSVEIRPSTPTISTAVLGTKLQLLLLGHYSDGTTQFLTESASWSSSVTTKATISTTAGSKGLATSTGYGTTTITASYSGFTVTATLTVQQPTVTSIAVTPSSPTIASGTAIQFTAVATYSDGSTQTITTAATWTSSDTAVATVSNTAGSQGLTTAIAPGTSTITATYNGVSGAATITVTAVSGAAGRFVYAANQGSNVSGYILDQATGALTAVPGSPVSYSNGVLSVASHPSGRFVYVGGYYGVTGFSSNGTTGQLTPIPGGNPFFGYTGTFPNPLPYVYALAVDPTGRYVYAANQQASTVSAYMVDGGNGALTPVATYATGQCPYSVTVDPSGKFVYVGNGCGTGGVSAYAIDGSTGGLTPVAGSPFGGTAVTAVAAAPNGQVLYAISSNSIRGYIINSTTGGLTLISGFPVTTSVCCTQFSGLTVDPAGRFLYAAASSGSVSAYRIDAVTGGITAVAGSPFTVGTNTYSVSVDASGKFLYVSSYASTSGNPGAVVALAINQTTGALTVAPGSPFAAGSVTYAVTTTGAVVSSAATLQSVEISPTAPTMSTAVLGTKLQLVLLGHYSDGTTQFLTESASWSSSVTTKATISTTAGSKGLATSTGYGATTITAAYSVFTVTATLTVQQPTVASIAVTPTSPTIASGTAIQYTAVATYSDGSTQTITAAAAWTSSDTAVATVSNAAGSQGLTTALAPGTSTITATYNGVSGMASITVQ